MSFFDASEAISRPTTGSLLPKCGACGLYKSCDSPKLGIVGSGRRKILIVGEYPDAAEDSRGEFLAGESGRLLKRTLQSFGIDIEDDCWYTSALICRPPKKEVGGEIEHCRPNLVTAINQLQPNVIIPLGFAAVKSLLVPYYRDGVGKMSTWAGWCIPLRKLNAWICPTYSPSQVIAAEEDRNGPVARLLFEQHLEEAVSKGTRPWSDSPPDYAKEVRLLYDESDIIDWLKRCVQKNKPTAFDWETSALKPEAEGSSIVSAGLFSDGETVAFSVRSERVKKGLAKFCESDVPKIGANNKFEDRWARHALGVPVNNWVWDCMLSSHHLDNRPDITSVKFQAFVLLGLEPWDYKIKRFFDSEHAMSLNRIHDIEERSLLIYNGVDARVEFEVARKQKEVMKWQNL